MNDDEVQTSLTTTMRSPNTSKYTNRLSTTTSSPLMQIRWPRNVHASLQIPGNRAYAFVSRGKADGSLRGVPIPRACDKITKTNTGRRRVPEGGEGRTTRPERTSRAGPLAVTFSLRRIHFPSPRRPRIHRRRAPPVHEPPREQTTSEFVA